MICVRNTYIEATNKGISHCLYKVHIRLRIRTSLRYRLKNNFEIIFRTFNSSILVLVEHSVINATFVST